MTANATITLAGRDYKVRPLTLGQLRIILPAFARAGRIDADSGVDSAIDIVSAALSRDHAEITRDALLDMEVTPKELTGAVGAIALLSGLVAGDAQAGEAGAAPSAGAESTVS